MLLDFHANPLQIEPHLLQHRDSYALSKFDQSEQQVFRSHVIVVEPLGLLARKRQDLLGARSKIIHYCVSEAGRRLSLLKVDTTPGTSTFTIGNLDRQIVVALGLAYSRRDLQQGVGLPCESPAPPALRGPLGEKATHVLDGLLYHQSDLQIEEHYTDTAGFTDHVFALCHLLGFRFVPRIRDLADRRLYVPDKGSTYPALGNLIGGTLSVRQMAAQWKEILLSAVR